MRVSAIMHAEFGTLTIDGVTAPFSSSPPFENTDLVMTVTGNDLVIRTGVNMGPVRVDLERCQSAPEPEGDGVWDDLVEVSGRRISGVPVSVHGPTEMPPYGAEELGTSGGEVVTVRIHTSGRGDARDLAVDESIERYLIQVWTPPGAPSSHTESRSGTWTAVLPDVIGEVSPEVSCQSSS